MRDETGTITHWVSVQRDVTERRRMNERLLMVQEQERHRLGHQMHEEMGGHLAALQMAVHRTQEDTVESPHFDEIKEQIEALADIVRRRTEEAAPRILTDYGLSEALPHLIRTLETDRDLSIELHNELGPGQPLSPLLGRVVYRIVREALLIVSDHGGSDSASLLLETVDGQLRMQVIDHGPAMTPDRDAGSEDMYGLPGIKERVQKLNGSFTVQPNDDDGTRLTVRLPLRLISPNASLLGPIDSEHSSPSFSGL